MSNPTYTIVKNGESITLTQTQAIKMQKDALKVMGCTYDSDADALHDFLLIYGPRLSEDMSKPKGHK